MINSSYKLCGQGFSMKILDTQVLRGPNYWSNYRKTLIVITLDLEEYEQCPTNLLAGFSDSLKNLMPSLYEHRCSIGTPGGFFARLDEGTWLGHVIEHIALELQTMAGMDCGFGRTYGTSEEGVYKIIFSYVIEEAGLFAGRAAVEIAACLAKKKEYSKLDEIIAELQSINEGEALGPSTESIVNEAKKRKIPVSKFKDSSLIILGQGCYQKKMWATVSSHTSNLGVDIAANKELTKNILEKSFVPVPKGLNIKTLEELDDAIARLEYPLVIKPHNGNHGRGILTHINDREKAIMGFNLAKQVSSSIIVEHMISGDDYRFLVVDYKLVAVAKRTPALVTGDGEHTVQELLDIENQNPKRGSAHENVLTKIKVDDATLSILTEQNLTLNSIIPNGKIVYLKGTANLSSGGTATDVTGVVHPANIKLAERIARLIDLDICGIDIVAETVTAPITKTNGAVIEVNAGPGFRMHLEPTDGKPRNVAAAVIDMLFPINKTGRIPVVAVTGTNGKTTVVRLIAHLAKKANFHVGFTTTEGVYSNDYLTYSGDCSGPLSTTAVLSDPLVDFAVLECARGGILRAGLGFDECDISVITNVSSDHLGLKEIHSLEELADVKAVVARSTKKDGYAILNAEDELVYAMRQDLDCKTALFAMHENGYVKEHCNDGGLACYLENDYIVVQEGLNKHYLVNIKDIPMTFAGTATCMIQNILPAVLAGVVSHFPLKEIESALIEFLPTSENLPGRMNIFDFKHHQQVMIDYAHNEGAFIELEKYLSTVKNKKKIGIIGATGDRRATDIQKIGYYSAQMFDEIIIRHDKDGRGSSNDYLTNLIQQGISLSQHHPKVEIISDEFTAIKHALSHSPDESFIFYSPEDVFKAIDFIQNEQDKEFNQNDEPTWK